MLKSKKPVIAVCAVRTGCGKSPTTRKIAKILKRRGKGVVVVRHPMPYGDLKEQTCQRFATMRDLDEQKATIEEREEYEPLIEDGLVVYAGVDYKKILDAAEKEADIIIWDGGNNDFPFFRPDLLIVLCDARRAGHEISYHPGETNLRMADVIVINKVRTAGKSEVKTIMANAKDCNPKAKIILADMPKTVDSPEKIRNKKVLVIEDGPTLTHGGLDYGAGYLAAKACNAKPVSPLPFAVGTIKATFRKYPHLKLVLPAMGYSKKQMKELEETINRARCDAVVIGTPVDLRKHLKLSKPAVRVTYSLEEIGRPKLEEVLKAFM
jgi:predicted GTPase